MDGQNRGTYHLTPPISQQGSVQRTIVGDTLGTSVDLCRTEIACIQVEEGVCEKCICCPPDNPDKKKGDALRSVTPVRETQVP